MSPCRRKAASVKPRCGRPLRPCRSARLCSTACLAPTLMLAKPLDTPVLKVPRIHFNICQHSCQLHRSSPHACQQSKQQIYLGPLQVGVHQLAQRLGGLVPAVARVEVDNAREVRLPEEDELVAEGRVAASAMARQRPVVEQATELATDTCRSRARRSCAPAGSPLRPTPTLCHGPPTTQAADQVADTVCTKKKTVPKHRSMKVSASTVGSAIVMPYLV